MIAIDTRYKALYAISHRLRIDNDQLLPEESAMAVQRGIKDCRNVNFPTLNHYTIIFGVEVGPAREIRSFVDKE